jgi:hypothetical protein
VLLLIGNYLCYGCCVIASVCNGGYGETEQSEGCDIIV